MTKKSSLLLAVVVTLALLSYGSVALAADAAPGAGVAAAPAAKAAPATPPAAPAAPAAKAAEKRVEATVTGKIESKTVTNKKTGKEVKVCRVQVSSAKAADGSALDTLTGKWLRVVGPKVADVEKFDGKEATLAGAVVGDKRIKVDSVK